MPPSGPAPYVVDQMEPGVFNSYRRNPDWWWQGPALQPRTVELDEIRYDYFALPEAIFERSRPERSPAIAKATPPSGCRTTIFRRCSRATW